MVSTLQVSKAILSLSATHLMLRTVVIRQLQPLLSQMFLHERVHDYLLTNGMSRNFPRQLTSPAFLRVGVSGGFDVLIVVVVHLYAVQLANSSCGISVSEPLGDLP